MKLKGNVVELPGVLHRCRQEGTGTGAIRRCTPNRLLELVAGILTVRDLAGLAADIGNSGK